MADILDNELKKKTGTATAATSGTGSATVSNPDSVMSADDQARVEWYREIYNDALARGDKETMEAAHQSVEDIRAGYGYSGGVDGTQYITEGIATPAGDYKDAGLSAESQRVVDGARLEYYKALNNDDKDAMEYWHQVAEAERSNADTPYSGGTDGSEFIPIQKQTAVSSSSSAPRVELPDVSGFFGALETPELTALQIPTAPDVEITDYSQYIQEMQDANEKATLSELEEAYQKNVNSIDRAGVGVDEAYQDARNQVAGAADLANRNFAEIANASGMSSGAGGQAALARGVTTQNNLHSLGLQEAQTLADLQQQRADNDVWYNSAIAQAKAEGDAQTAQLLYQEKIRVESATIEAIQRKFANEITTYQMQFDAEQQNFANEVSKKQMEYQALRDSVSDTKWQAEFDLAYEQWLKSVELQQAQMAFQREQWEQSVAAQQEQLAIQKESLDAELKQMETSNNQWQQSFNAANNQWQQEFDAALNQWQQSFNTSMGQYQDAQTQQAWENWFNQEKYDDAQSQQEWENKFAQQQYRDAMTSSDAYKVVNEELVAMVKAGANLTELRAALRGALNEGILTQTEYEQLCAAYTPGWST